jgi:hypothetical protein
VSGRVPGGGARVTFGRVSCRLVWTAYDECRMVCLEKVRLVQEYSAASSALVMANTKLKAARETDVGISDSLGVWKAASAKCVDTRQALLEHKAEHGC